MLGDVGSVARTDHETASQEIIPSPQDQELLPLNPEEEEFLMSEIMGQSVDDVGYNYVKIFE